VNAVARVALLTVVAIAAACKTVPQAPRFAEPEHMPSYKTIADTYNKRVEKLDRIASGADIVVNRFDENAKPVTDQVEGYLQFRKPLSLNIRFDKVGSTIFVLGSNDREYWWFDLSDENYGFHGTHDNATRETVLEFGVPVRPADLVRAFGVIELDPAANPRVSWNADNGRIVLAFENHRIQLDPVSLEPTRIELSEAGKLLVEADLSRYVDVPVRGDALNRPRMASRMDLTLTGLDIRVGITFSSLENPRERQKDANFDLAGLVDRYGIDRMINLDPPESDESPIDQPTP
jgi:hypothetical protein